MTNTEENNSAALWVVLARAYRAMATFVEHSLASLDIGLSDFMILEALLHKGPLTMSELCNAALITNASMTAAIDRLEKRELVERTSNKEDRRARVVQLTPAGTALIRKLYPRHLKDLETAMEGLTQKERSEIRAGLKKLGLAAEELARRDNKST